MNRRPEKIAIINATGTRELPLLDRLVDHGHHLAYITGTELPRHFVERHPRLTFFEHHHIRLDDIRQLVTALQGCRIAVLCLSSLPLVAAGDRARLVSACHRAGIVDLVDLDLAHLDPMVPLPRNGPHPEPAIHAAPALPVADMALAS